MLSIIKRLIKGSVIYGSGRFVQNIIGFLLIPVYTRYLTTTDYGIVAVAGSIASILEILLGMGFTVAVVRQYYDYVDSQEGVSEYIGTLFLFSLLVSFLTIGALTIFGGSLFDALRSKVPFRPYILLTLWTALFGTTGNILLSLYRAREQASYYVMLKTGQFIISLGMVIYLVVMLRQGALGAIRGSFLVGLLFFFVFLLLTLREGGVQFSISKLRNALKLGLPILPHLLSGWVLSVLDRLLLERMTSLSEVGLYNLGYRIGMVMSLIVSAINYAWTPIFYDIAKNVKDHRIILSRMFTLYIVMTSTLAVGVILFSREVILIMAAKPFHRAYLVAPTVALGYLFQGLYFMSVTPIFYEKKTYIMPLLTGVAATANIGFNMLWIPKFGIMGAAYATLVSFALLFLLTHYIAQGYYRLPYDYRRITITVLLVAGIYLLNSAMPFKGIMAPLAIKMGMVLAFLSGTLFFRVISFQELGKIRELFRRSPVTFNEQ
jgi:O-antigen/teichoic acid export membrane protein